MVFFALLAALFAYALLSDPAWSQEKQKEEKRSSQTSKQVSEEQRAKIERLSDAQLEDQLVQAAQTSNAAGELNGEPATATDDASDFGTEVDRIVIEGAENCRVASDATITFQETTGDGEVGVVSNGSGAIIDPRTSRIVITGDPSGDIIFAAGDLDPGPLEVLSSSGIDCDGDNDDEFDDELLLLLLLELLEDNNDDFDNFDDDDNDGIPDFFDEDFDEDFDDEDEDGDIDQDDDLVDAEQDLEDAEVTTDSEFDSDSDGDGVSATSDGDGAKASTPGAFAESGGDPDEQAPVTGPQGNVVDEIPTSGPLPETGGMPVATGTVLALVFFGAGLLAVRLMIWRERRA